MLLVLIASFVANLAIEEVSGFALEDLLRLEAALFAGAAAAVAAALFLEARGMEAAIRYGAQLLAAFLFGSAVWFGLDWGVYPPALIVGLTLAIPLAPYLGRGDGMSFWTFTVFLVIGTMLAFAAVLVFVLGVVAIIEMIAFLFDLNPPTSVNRHIVVTALTLVGPLFALGRVPSQFDETVDIGEDEHFVRGIALLAGWVTAPLALVAGLVLYLYGAKILATSVVPKGEIGWIVSTFSLLVVLLRIAAEPIQKIGGVALRLFCRIWPWLLILPLGLLAYAVWTRIEAEGVTIARYYLALEGLGAAILTVLALLRRRQFDIRWLAGIPVAMVLLSAFGPQGVADAVGRSQADRIARVFTGELDAKAVEALDARARGEIRSRIYALAEVDQLDRLKNLFAYDAVARGNTPRETARAVIVALDLDAPPQQESSVTIAFARTEPVDIEGFDRIAFAVRFGAATAPDALSDEAQNRPALKDAGQGSDAAPRPTGRIDRETGQLIVRIGGTTDRFALESKLAETEREASAQSGRRSDLAPLELEGRGGRSIRLLVTQASVAGEGELAGFEADLLFRSSEWTR
ncbi:DUF4153 domain-containing protein [Fulvimarina sp. 2208YS6-2-32]|uniref:DUF4153 domain-containing protein n=1 Tax=Fulvimarina uroteuthidis TaxID=3098149 RepID=UPI003A1010FD